MAKENTGRYSTYSLVVMALFVALLCVSSYISIPLPLPGAPHITMLNFMILLIAMLFPLKNSVMIIGVWMLLGIIGLPVFIAGRSTAAYLIAPWGGYTMAFLVPAVFLPLLCRGEYKRVRFMIAAAAAAVVIDLLGMLWLMKTNQLNLTEGIAIGFIPFIPFDLLKAFAAAQLIPAFRRIVRMGQI